MKKEEEKENRKKN